MISLQAAIEIIRSTRSTGLDEFAPLASASNRRLAADISAPFDFPQFDNSAMDGYAVGGPVGPWKVIGELPAGSVWNQPLGTNEAVHIFTGAPVPENTYSVVAQENSALDDELLTATTSAGAHIRRQGEELQRGTMVARQGMKITPPVMASLAAMGFGLVSVISSPRTLIVTTGSEVVDATQNIGAGKIYNSNAFAILSFLRELGVRAEHVHVGDGANELTSLLCDSIDSFDLFITSGGVSVGKHDHVKESMTATKFDMLFERVAMKPGKPTTFAKRQDGKAWFGLPGNPMSTWVGLLLFVAEYLGEPTQRKSACLAHSANHNPGRDEFVPFTFVESDTIQLHCTVGSHSNFGLIDANGIAHLPADLELFPEGIKVSTHIFPWSDSR